MGLGVVLFFSPPDEEIKQSELGYKMQSPAWIRREPLETKARGRVVL